MFVTICHATTCYRPCRLLYHHVVFVTARHQADCFVTRLCLSTFVTRHYQAYCFVIMLSLSPVVTHATRQTALSSGCVCHHLSHTLPGRLLCHQVVFVTTCYQADCFVIVLSLSPFVAHVTWQTALSSGCVCHHLSLRRMEGFVLPSTRIL